MINKIRTAEDFLNVVMAIKRGVSYQQLKNEGFSSDEILVCKKAILYVEACYKNKLSGRTNKNSKLRGDF